MDAMVVDPEDGSTVAETPEPCLVVNTPKANVMRDVPPEIFARILMMGERARFGHVYPPLLVCRWWHAVAITVPDLWTRLTIYDKNIQKKSNCLALFIARSSWRPLSIDIDLRTSREYGDVVGDIVTNTSHADLEPLVRVAHRWEWLHFAANHIYWLPWLMFHLPDAVNLRFLTIAGRGPWPAERVALPNIILPNLRCLNSASLRGNQLTHLVCPQLETFSFKRGKLASDDLLAFGERMPSLSTLILSSVHPEEFAADVDNMERVQFHNLESFKLCSVTVDTWEEFHWILKGTQSLRLLEATCPSLHHFYVGEWNSDKLTILNLTIHRPDMPDNISGEDTTVDEDDIASLYAGVPNLREFKLSWISDHDEELSCFNPFLDVLCERNNTGFKYLPKLSVLVLEQLMFELEVLLGFLQVRSTEQVSLGGGKWLTNPFPVGVTVKQCLGLPDFQTTGYLANALDPLPGIKQKPVHFHARTEREIWKEWGAAPCYLGYAIE